jgi:methylenetetrahydrofolate--tRNA-(uracil-5-)-methyltransferase
VLATGPLTAGGLAADLQRVLGEEYLYFYDALSPIVYADSIDMEIAFRASRYEDGPGDYLNLPLDRTTYEAFVAELIAATRYRSTRSRPRSTSRAACRSRRWRAAAATRSPTVR